MVVPAPSTLDRRQFLSALGATGAALWVAPARAAAPAAHLTLAQLKHGASWNPRPTALRRLLWELGERTSIVVEADAQAVEPCDRKLFYLPFAYLAVEGALAPLDDCLRSALRTYLANGGTLLVDAVDGGAGTAFDQSVRSELGAVCGGPPAAVPREHVIYKSFYLLDGAAGRTAASPDLDAFTVDNRLAAVICHNDLGGAWARSNLGLWEHDVVPGGQAQRERALRLGVNLVMYALCTDYKEDQVHIPFILKKRRR